jgi:hypothetical protein
MREAAGALIADWRERGRELRFEAAIACEQFLAEAGRQLINSSSKDFAATSEQAMRMPPLRHAFAELACFR